MPAAYLSMKHKFMADGMAEKDAEAKAAAIYNSKHKKNPVGRYHHEAILKGHEIGQKISRLIEDIFRSRES